MIEVLVVDDDIRVARVNAAYVAKVPGFHVAGAGPHAPPRRCASWRRCPGWTWSSWTTTCPTRRGSRSSRRLRRRGHQTDVIMVTAARDVATVQAAMRHGALQYLVKPFTFAGPARQAGGVRGAAPHPGRRRGGRTGRGGPHLRRPVGRRRRPGLPKGHSPTTAELVRQVPCCAPTGPLSAQEIAERAGVSRQTAQRYLKLLERTGRVQADPQVRRDAAARNTATTGSRAPDRLARNRPAAGRRRPLRPRPPRSAPAPPSPRAWPRPAVSAEMTVPSQPARKPSGIETSPGFCSGKTWKSTPGNSDSGLPETTGDSTTSTTAGTSPP